MASSPSAASRVFDITELHEKILVHLSPLDILHAQRVDRTWVATIKGSTVIQRIIYPQPIDSNTAWILEYHLNKLLDEELFGYYISDVVATADMKRCYATNEFASSATFNDLLLRRRSIDECTTASKRASVGEVLELTQEANDVLFLDERTLSCDNMLLVNITLCQVEVMVKCRCGGPLSSINCLNTSRFGRLFNAEGLRVKDLRNHVRKICPRSRVHAIAFPEACDYDDRFANSPTGILFPTEAEAHRVNEIKKLDVKWSQ